jgi:DNA-binding XRE family transcriptional regulator
VDKQQMQSHLKELGKSQAQLAKKLETYPATVSNWKKVPPAVAEFLRVSVQLKRLLDWGEK